MAPILTTHRLARSFETRNGTVEAVRGIDMAVEPGEILGFLGPNGAGKSTTLRMLTTLLPPTRGTATVAGHDLAREPSAVRSRIGYVAQSSGVDPNETVRDELVLQGRLYRLPHRQARVRAEELAGELDLADLLDRPCRALSGGQRRRLDIALALTHRPAVLFLDEPTTGLDPGSRAGVWGMIRRIREELGTTIFLTTHYLDEADALADRLVIVDGGRIAAEGDPAGLKVRYGGSPDATLQDTFIAVTGHGPAGDDPAPLSVRPPPGREPIRPMTAPPPASAVPGASGVPGAGGPAPAAPTLSSVLSDTGLIFRRYLRQTLRSRISLVFGMLQPMLFLTFFGPLLEEMPLGGEGDSWQTLVPGLLIQLGLFSAAFAGFGIIMEKQLGIVERMRVTPVSRLALLLGRVLRDAVLLLVQSLLLVLVGVAFGLRAPVPGVLTGFAFVGVLAVSLASLSCAVAMRVDTVQEFAPVINSVNLPVMLLSGILLPMALAPGWLDALSRIIPLRYMVEGIRAAFVGNYGDGTLALGALVALALAAVSVTLGSRLFQRAGA